MKQGITTVKRCALMCAMALIVIAPGMSSIAWADDTTPPVSPDATPYVYNVTSGLWESDTYTWNPATGQTVPKTAQNYSYNPATSHWDDPNWKYDPTTNTYVPNVVAPTPIPPTPPVTPGSGSETAASQPVAQVPSQPVTTSASGSTYDSFYNAAISNPINSTATSGNASVLANTSGGSATTGNATAVANVINLLQSSASLTGDKLSTFTTAINGDVNGNLLIDPAQIGVIQAANTANTVAINSTGTNNLDNNMAVTAASGNATVSSNALAGDATTGTANAVADVVNLINSTIAAKQSFLGVINIYGNLNGDITVPQHFVDSLLANNTAQLTNANQQSIANDLTASAKTGSAIVSANTTAGNATTGDAANTVTILNLAGQNVVAANSLLVFVNVLGHWVGLIMNAPNGSSAAALGGGVTTNTVNNAVAANNTNTDHITNTIGLTADSGNALVSENTSAGSAHSGNATTSANLANLTGSNLRLSNWFGILFINVFGNWLGSFGVEPAPATYMGSMASPAPKVFQFVSAAPGAARNQSAYQLANVRQNTQSAASTSVVATRLEHSQLTAGKRTTASTAKPLQPEYSRANEVFAAGIIGLGICLFGIDGLRSYRHKRN